MATCAQDGCSALVAADQLAMYREYIKESEVSGDIRSIRQSEGIEVNTSFETNELEDNEELAGRICSPTWDRPTELG